MSESVTQRMLAVAASGTSGLRTIRRPSTEIAPAFDLAYARTGPRGRIPAVVIPGGPGLGSVLPYRGMRRWAARGGLDLIMVEHRGVGLSRTDVAGADLPFSAMRVEAVIDDIAAVLDQEGIHQAVIAGSSYGSYLASGFGARHGDRVAGMLLDSALQSTADLGIERRALRELFWDARTPLARHVRRLVQAGEDERRLLDIVRAAYELGGSELTLPLLEQRVRGRRSLVWTALGAYATRDASIARIPGIYDFDIAGAIGFRELHYGAPLDGLPFDPALTYAPSAGSFPPFEGEPFDLPALTPSFPWPLIALSGTRDLRTPSDIARRTAQTAQRGMFLSIENGHSALDTHPAAMLNVVRRLAEGRHETLPGVQSALDTLPKRGLSAGLPRYLNRLLSYEIRMTDRATR